MRDSLRRFNPYVVAVYYIVVTGASVMSRHPVLCLISFVAAVLYGFKTDRDKLLNLLKIIFPLMLFTILINGLFNHYGVTRLFRLPSGNKVTLEVLFQSILLTASFGSVSVWLLVSTDALGYEKCMYMLRNLFPSVVLVMTMSIRFLPLYARETKVITSAQQGVGNLKEEKRFLKKIKNGLGVFSVLSSWALENSIVTAESMRSRGFGLSKRTSYRRYSFNVKDLFLLVFCLVTAVLLIVAGSKGFLTVKYNPVIRFPVFDAVGYAAYVAFGVLCLLPLVIELYGERKWRI